MMTVKRAGPRWWMLLVLGAALSLATATAGRAQTTAAGAPDLDPAKTPWSDGEELVYEVQWGMVRAARGTFTATRRQPDGWRFNLHLESLGTVDNLYPIRSWFWSITAEKPWRSIEYGEERFERSKHIAEMTRPDYRAQTARRHRWSEGTHQDFKIEAPALDDPGSMLYSLRHGDWAKGTRRTFLVYESRHQRGGEARCTAVERIPLSEEKGAPLVECYRIEAQPMDPNLRKRGHAVIWMSTDPRRIPIRCDLKFKYGTFVIRFVKATPPWKPKK